MTRAAAIFAVLVAMLAAGAVLAQSVTTVRVVRSQTVLQAEDLVLAEASVPGGIAAIEAVVGQEAKVALYPGRPILDSQLGAPALVERNQVVRMSYASGPLRIVTDGRVLDRAGAGEPVRVMNLASRQTVSGTVAADGSIEVGP
jgi:flagellar basal body P-ring formation protein FlgA